jgi:hypothetical protein
MAGQSAGLTPIAALPVVALQGRTAMVPPVVPQIIKPPRARAAAAGAEAAQPVETATCLPATQGLAATEIVEPVEVRATREAGLGTEPQGQAAAVVVGNTQTTPTAVTEEPATSSTDRTAVAAVVAAVVAVILITAHWRGMAG